VYHNKAMHTVNAVLGFVKKQLKLGNVQLYEQCQQTLFLYLTHKYQTDIFINAFQN